jgi:hypothetical protein
MQDLKQWFETVAGFTGRKLDKCLEQCTNLLHPNSMSLTRIYEGQDNFTESVSDLRRLVDDDKSFKDVIPQGQLRSDIIKAFKGSLKSEDLPTQMMRPTKTHSSATTQQQTRSPTQLPPHKSFGAFISHKKVTAQQ